MNTHVVGSLTFKTQADLKYYTKEILSRHLNKTIDHGYDFEFITQVFSRHPEWAEKKGTGVIAYKITSNMGSYHVDILRTDGTEIDISWNTAVRGRGRTVHGDRMKELRESVDEQIKEFRRSQGHITHCPRCKIPLTSAPHVDHTPSFRTLVTLFDTSGADNFALYHKQNASLQFLCGPCNFKKGTSDELL